MVYHIFYLTIIRYKTLKNTILKILMRTQYNDFTSKVIEIVVFLLHVGKEHNGNEGVC